MQSYGNETANPIVTDLPLGACYLANLPDNRIDCSTVDPNECVSCPILGRFITGEGIDEYTALGHFICLLIWILITAIGIFGILGNVLIILILKRQNSGRAFDTFLVGLAGFDLVCSITSVMSGFASVFYFQNWNRNVVTMWAFYIGSLTALFGRSGSAFMTVVITFERYLVVAFPLKFGNWFTVKRTRYCVLGVVIWAFVMAFPRYSSAYVGRNVAGRNVPSVRELDYTLLSTSLYKLWYFDTKGFFDQIDFWGPLPLLLLLNGLVYYYVRKFELRRNQLTHKHRKEIRAARNFLPIVIVLFLCNIEPIVYYYFLFTQGIVYRELVMGLFLAFVVNSAVNLPIYYLKGSSFRKETRALMHSYFSGLARYFQNTNDDEYNSRATSSTGADQYTMRGA